MHYWVHKEAAASPRARISFFKNGKFQGYAFEDIESGRASFVFVVGLFCLYTRSLLTAIPCDRYAFEDIWSGTYYPAASFYYGGCATANFGPEFRFPPKCPVSRSGVKVERGEGGGERERYVRYRPISDSAQELQLWNKIALEEEERVSLGCLSGAVEEERVSVGSGAGSRSLTPPLPLSSPGLPPPPPPTHITISPYYYYYFLFSFYYSLTPPLSSSSPGLLPPFTPYHYDFFFFFLLFSYSSPSLVLY
jgi:hypothetical protein